jgi:hypothetical protein
MTTRTLLLATAAAVLLLNTPALAQQPAPEGQRQDETPTLTTDDIAPLPVEGQPAGAQTEEPPEGEDDSQLTPEERADAAKSKGKGKGAEGKAPAGKKGPSKAELAWRARVAQAEAQASAARQAAQEAELQLTELRNRLASAGSVDERNELASEMETQGEAVRQAQQAASNAEAALKSVKAEGTAQKFKPDPGPAPTTKAGEPNAAYYTQRYAKAQGEYADAERRIKVYQDRVNDVRGRILNNSGSGDQFAGMKLQEELDAALKQLDKAQTDLDTAGQRVESARQEAASAGVVLPR